MTKFLILRKRNKVYTDHHDIIFSIIPTHRHKIFVIKTFLSMPENLKDYLHFTNNLKSMHFTVGYRNTKIFATETHL